MPELPYISTVSQILNIWIYVLNELEFEITPYFMGNNTQLSCKDFCDIGITAWKICQNSLIECLKLMTGIDFDAEKMKRGN